MEYFGLILEILFLILGIYLYLFTRGVVNSKDPVMQEKADAFRKKNAGWMRLLSLALIAVMTLEIILHVRDLMQ
ncbi:MAG: hypothetical protein AAF985_14325 [Bacteroidota bacterium]